MKQFLDYDGLELELELEGLEALGELNLLDGGLELVDGLEALGDLNLLDDGLELELDGLEALGELNLLDDDDLELDGLLDLD